MSKKPTSITLDEETVKLIEEIGREMMLGDNKSLVIRYCVKYTANKLLFLNEEQEERRQEKKERDMRYADYSDQEG